MHAHPVHAHPVHAHTWQLFSAVLRRYRCTDPACNAVGYAPVGRRRQVIPYKCQHELDGRRHCGEPATFAGHLKTQHRCEAHRPQTAQTSSAASAA